MHFGTGSFLFFEFTIVINCQLPKDRFKVGQIAANAQVYSSLI